MKKTLFIGNFLSKKRGTKGIAERIAERQAEFNGINLILASRFENKLVRLLDITTKSLFFDYTVVIIDVYSGAYFFIVRVATRIATIRKKKIILNLRGGKLHELEQQNPSLFKRVLTRAEKIISPSLFLKESLKLQGYEISYVPNFIDIERFPYRQEMNSNSLLWVRAFVSIYNPTMALQVLAEVRKTIPDATLTMIGPDHGELNRCIEMIVKLNLQAAVTIEGRVDNSRLIQYYHKHGVFLNTTSYESFGLAVLEAASAGIPIVSNRVGEIAYLWKESEEILMCDHGDVQQMAAHVLTLLQNNVYAQNLSQAARSKAEKFSWAVIQQEWKKMME